MRGVQCLDVQTHARQQVRHGARRRGDGVAHAPDGAEDERDALKVVVAALEQRAVQCAALLDLAAGDGTRQSEERGTSQLGRHRLVLRVLLPQVLSVLTEA